MRDRRRPARRRGESLAQDLTRLADLRAQPLALAQFLLAIPDEVLERTGEILMQRLRGAARTASPRATAG